MTMIRIRAAWQNWPGAPGVTTFYQDPAVAQADAASVRTMFNAIAALLPSGLTVTVPATGDLIEENTGALSGSWSVTPAPTVVTGTGTGAYAGNAGAVMHWLTTTVVNGRRVRGRSFIVPLIGSAFFTDGSLATATITTLANAASAMIATTADHFVVWHRPRPGIPGSKAPVVSSSVPDLAISLRSRRI